MKIFEPKIVSTFKDYNASKFASDIIAGIIVAIIALPLSIALAIASGVQPVQGLYTAIVAGFVIALLGGSRVNISGPTAAFATMIAMIVAEQGMDGLVIATIMAGLILILLGILKIGSFIKYMPHSITTGFTSGIALTIVIGQLKDFFSLTYPENAHNIHTPDKVMNVINYFSTVNWWAVLVGVIGLIVLIGWPKINKKIPASLIAVFVGVGVVMIFKMDVATIGSQYGEISSALPTFSLPTITGEKIVSLLPSAIKIAILAGIESLLSCVVSDGMIDDKHNSNTELIAQGTGNIFSGLFGGIPATGAIARTAANVKNGGRSPVSGMVHAIVLLLVLVFLMPYAKWIPMPIIAAILFIVAYNMSEWREFVHIVKTSHWTEIVVLLTTFVLTVALDLVYAIVVGVVLSAIFYFIKKGKDNK